MDVVNVRKTELNKQGYESLSEWKKEGNHLYIGRNMSFYVPGAVGSKWRNPYTVKKYGLDKSLELYEKHVRDKLYDDLDELDGKILGCWCKPERCHGDILVKMLKAKKN